jgi:hypothetical protein
MIETVTHQETLLYDMANVINCDIRFAPLALVE